MAKVIVTGGAGFIGSHIVESMLAEGHKVSVIDDLSSGIRENLPSEAALMVLDIGSKEAADFLSHQEPDILVHAAAQMSVRVSMDDPLLDTRVNILGLVNLLQSFRGKKLPYTVFLSTGGAIYGEQEVFPAPESHPTRPASIYGLAKKVSEFYLDFWAREWGLSYSALRLGNVYGPRQNPHGEAGVVAIFIKNLLNGSQPTINGTGDQTRDFVYVKDVVNAVMRACSAQKKGTFNIGTGRESSVNEVYRHIVNSLRSDVSPHYGAAKQGEQMRSSIDSNLAARELGWKPAVNLSEGIEHTVRWFKDR
jgi:UDP-glucose 4-epimerase